MPYERIHDRPGNLELAKSMNELILFIDREGTGNLKKDKALWTLAKGLNSDTVRKHFQILFDAEALVENSGSYQKLPLFYVLLKQARKNAGLQEEEYVQRKDTEKKPKFSKATQGFFDQMEIKEKMKAGPCKGMECPPFTEEGCQDCSAYAKYTGDYYPENELKKKSDEAPPPKRKGAWER